MEALERLLTAAPSAEAALPEGWIARRTYDLLGFSYDGNVLLVNFSDQLAKAAEDMDGKAVEQMVYGLVNTLCCLPGVKRVAIFVAGTQPETLGGTIFLPGDFMPSPNAEE